MDKNLVPLTLEQHQQIIYEILYMVDDFCKAHDIPYFLVGGTLLGAVRHQGIIPWDDDADIAMTRENYNRFVTLFHAEGVYGYELYDFEHTDGYLFPFAKMAKVNSFVPTSKIKRIAIDIFVYDGCGDDKEQALTYFTKKRKKMSEFAKQIIFCHPFSETYDCWKSKLVYFITKFPKESITFYPFILQSSWLQKIFLYRFSSELSQKRVNSSEYSACIVWGLYGEGEVQNSSSFQILDTMDFGSRKLPVPSRWHEYLTSIYGDYKTLPPEKDRRPRHSQSSFCL